jgi:sec-independent protein translocase protein TatA
MILFSGLILAGIGPTEITLILVIVLLFFGGKKIPELMKGLGQGMKEFKDASKGEDKKTTTSTEVKPEDK